MSLPSSALTSLSFNAKKIAFKNFLFAVSAGAILFSLSAHAIDNNRLADGRYYVKELDQYPAEYGAWVRYYLTISGNRFAIQVAPDEREEQPHRDVSTGSLRSIVVTDQGKQKSMLEGTTDSNSGFVRSFIIGYKEDKIHEYLTTVKAQKTKNFRNLYLQINGKPQEDFVIEDYNLNPRDRAQNPPSIWK